MEEFIKQVLFIVENAKLESKEKNSLLQFIEMIKKDIKDVENAVNTGKLTIKEKSCFYKAYADCIKYACICQGIEDINEQILNELSK